MSLLSRERLVAVVAPHRAALTCARARGALEPIGDAACDGDGWADAADALEQLLAAAGRRRGELAVVLSGHFARFRLVPWSDAIGSPAELESYVRIGFEDVYGPGVADWALRVSPEAAGRPRIAVGVEQALLDRIAAIARGAGLRLASVQPHAVAAFNRLLPRLARRGFVLAVAEPGRCSLLVARDGAWVSVRSNASDDSDAAVVDLLERECELDGLVGDELPPVYVHVAGRGADAWPAMLGTTPEPLVIGRAQDVADPWIGMALAEA